MEPVRLIEVDSKIVGAVVYSERAHVTRRALAGLGAGASRVWLKGLPAELDPARVRVKTSFGRVRAVELDEIIKPIEGPTDNGASHVAELEKKLHLLEGEVDALSDELSRIDAVYPDANAEGGPGPLRPDLFLAGLEVLVKRRQATVHTLRVAEYERHLAAEALAVEVARLEHLGHTEEKARSHTALLVAIDADQVGDALIEVTYDVGWATWRPYYQLRLDRIAQRIEVVQQADVWQETGEDWSEIELRLSTAEPESGLELPEVKPWRLEKKRGFADQAADLYQSQKMSKERARAPMEMRAGPVPLAAPSSAPPPAPKSAPMLSRRMAMSDRVAQAFGGGGRADEESTGDLTPAAEQLREGEAASMQFEDAPEEDSYDDAMITGEYDVGGISDMPPPPPPPPNRPEPAPRREEPRRPDLERLQRSPMPRDASGGLDFELAVPGKSSLRSSREHQRSTLTTSSHPAKIDYLLRPVIKDHAFGRVTVTHGSQSPLLAGPAAVFVGEGYVGATQLATTPAGGKLTLDLGAETSIKCARRTRTSMKTSGLINKDDLHLVEVEIEVESFLDHGADLEIQDQVPISTDPKVKVKLIRTLPKDAVLDEQTGILTYRVKVAAGGRVELGLVYEIEAPKDYRLTQSLGG